MPPVTDPKTAHIQKVPVAGVKDFSGRYLKEGMWPGKISNTNSVIHDYNSVGVKSNRQSVHLTGGMDRFTPANKILYSSKNDQASSKTNVSGDETRIRPYIPGNIKSKDGSLTERPGSLMRGSGLSISRTIEIPPGSSMSQHHLLYPSNLDLNIVSKINSTLDHNYYKGQGAINKHQKSSSVSLNG